MSFRNPIYVYVAGPLTGDINHNVCRAVMAGSLLVGWGFTPYIPHLTVLWDMIAPAEYEYWMKQCFDWVAKCDALYRLHGESKGADREVELAKANGIPVFTDAGSILTWAENFTQTK